MKSGPKALLRAFSDPLNSRCMTDFSRIGAALESPPEIDQEDLVPAAYSLDLR